MIICPLWLKIFLISKVRWYIVSEFWNRSCTQLECKLISMKDRRFDPNSINCMIFFCSSQVRGSLPSFKRYVFLTHSTKNKVQLLDYLMSLKPTVVLKVYHLRRRSVLFVNNRPYCIWENRNAFWSIDETISFLFLSQE